MIPQLSAESQFLISCVFVALLITHVNSRSACQGGDLLAPLLRGSTGFWRGVRLGRSLVDVPMVPRWYAPPLLGSSLPGVIRCVHATRPDDLDLLVPFRMGSYARPLLGVSQE